MSSFCPSGHNRHYRKAISTLKKRFPHESDDEETALWFRQYRSDVETDFIECENHNSKSFSALPINSNSAHASPSVISTHDQFVSQLNSTPPSLQFSTSSEHSMYPSHFRLQTPKITSSNFSNRRENNTNNNTRTSQDWQREWRRTRRRSARKRKTKNNKQRETTHCHHRNVITVRRVSCHASFKKPLAIEEKSFEIDKIHDGCECHRSLTFSSPDDRSSISATSWLIGFFS